MKFLRALVLLPACALITSVPAARAGQIIDQQAVAGNSTSTQFAASPPSIGQSFTPALPLIDFVTLSLASSSDATFLVRLHAGLGFFNTPVIASTATLALVGGAALQTYGFDFASQVQINAGSFYTFELVVINPTSPLTLESRLAAENYAGGALISGGNGSPAIPFPDLDLAFSEGYSVSSVPEAPIPALLSAGFLAIAMLSRRARTA